MPPAPPAGAPALPPMPVWPPPPAPSVPACPIPEPPARPPLPLMPAAPLPEPAVPAPPPVVPAAPVETTELPGVQAGINSKARQAAASTQARTRTRRAPARLPPDGWSSATCSSFVRGNMVNEVPGVEPGITAAALNAKKLEMRMCLLVAPPAGRDRTQRYILIEGSDRPFGSRELEEKRRAR